MERFETADTGVFWDVDDCEIPDGLNALMVSQNMRSALERLNYRGKVFIYAYGDSNQILDTKMVVKQTPNKFDYRGTTSIYSEDDDLDSTPALMLNDTSRDYKDDMIGRILVDFMIWAIDNPAPANIILVLGSYMSRRQEEFQNAIGQFNMLNYNIHFAYPQNSICPSLPAVRVKWLWESLSLGGNPLSSVWEKEKE